MCLWVAQARCACCASLAYARRCRSLRFVMCACSLVVVVCVRVRAHAYCARVHSRWCTEVMCHEARCHARLHGRFTAADSEITYTCVRSCPPTHPPPVSKISELIKAILALILFRDVMARAVTTRVRHVTPRSFTPMPRTRAKMARVVPDDAAHRASLCQLLCSPPSARCHPQPLQAHTHTTHRRACTASFAQRRRATECAPNAVQPVLDTVTRAQRHPHPQPRQPRDFVALPPCNPQVVFLAAAPALPPHSRDGAPGGAPCR